MILENLTFWTYQITNVPEFVNTRFIKKLRMEVATRITG